jgi:glutathione peroxidase
MKLFAAVLLMAVGMFVHAEDKMPSSVFDVSMDGIDGRPYALSKHKGEVLLIVNVASQCGYTPQYKGLQALYAKYHEKGLTVVGVPANEFGAQEPGTNLEIKAFCSSKYDVTFPVLGKTVVKGEGICPLYKFLTTQKPGDIKWNFSKFLVDRNGKVLQRYESAVKPDDAKLIEAIESALAAKAN